MSRTRWCWGTPQNSCWSPDLVSASRRHESSHDAAGDVCREGRLEQRVSSDQVRSGEVRRGRLRSGQDSQGHLSYESCVSRSGQISLNRPGFRGGSWQWIPTRFSGRFAWPGRSLLLRRPRHSPREPAAVRLCARAFANGLQRLVPGLRPAGLRRTLGCGPAQPREGHMPIYLGFLRAPDR
jgi:hypothetical protein